MESEEFTLDQRWTVMDNEKPSTEFWKYAFWTFPKLYIKDGDENTTGRAAGSNLGPMLVNHLANLVVQVMFPSDHPFFITELKEEAKAKLKAEQDEDQVKETLELIREQYATVERVAAEELDLVSYLPKAVEGVKHLVVLGNVCIFRDDDLPGSPRVIYGIKDFCVHRRQDGSPYELMLHDKVRFIEMDPRDRKKLLEHSKMKQDDLVDYYTHFYQEAPGKRWVTRHSANNVELAGGKKYTPRDFPCIPLAWSIGRGEHYGTGLVGEHRAAFNAVNAGDEALLDMIAIMADVKFFVDATGGMNASEIAASPRGAWHQGRKEYLSHTDVRLANELNAVSSAVDRWEQRLSKIFLMSSTAVRDAERVTAEEIRFLARELNRSFGGLYSRLAVDWQSREANYLVSKVAPKLASATDLLSIRATTGHESMTREGRLNNLYEALTDAAVLESVPEDLRKVISPMRLFKYIFTQRQVPVDEILYTLKEYEAEQQREADMMKQQEMAKAGGAVAAAAGKAEMEQPNG